MQAPFRVLSTAALTIAFSASCSAQGVYLEFGGGLSSYSISCGSNPACDKKASAARALGGYQFASGLGVEGTLMSSSRATGSLRGGNATVELKGYGAGISYTADLGASASGSARIGIASVTAKGTQFTSNSQGNLSGSTLRPYIGASAAWAFNKSFGIGLAIDAWQGRYFEDSVRTVATTANIRVRF